MKRCVLSGLTAALQTLRALWPGCRAAQATIVRLITNFGPTVGTASAIIVGLAFATTFAWYVGATSPAAPVVCPR